MMLVACHVRYVIPGNCTMCLPKAGRFGTFDTQADRAILVQRATPVSSKVNSICLLQIRMI
jgi:hypothetical protein